MCKLIETNVSYEELKYAWADEFGVKYSADKKRLIKVPRDIEEYVINRETEVICDRAFDLCTKLKFISIPDGVIKVGNNSFSDCYELTYVSFSNTIENIGYNAFLRCN